ncbi:MAG TPA: GNAT family N-acyltransferase [Candidatus Limnocylindrales bacterium]|nr:GNAT family N-acyltransferase [Candidatus Limnocylindrales bacterium]
MALTEMALTEMAGRHEILDAIHALRYRVYAVEQEFVDIRHCPDGRETDAYDPASVHFASVDEEGGVGATMRLVLDSPAGFPLDQHAADLAPQYRSLPRERCTELSRLIVDRRYRAVRAERPLLLSLMGEAYREGSRLGIEHVLAAMEPRLARLLGRIGFRFRPIGPPIQHFGEVVPYYAPISDLTPGYRRITALGLATGDLASFRCLKVSPDAVEASV